jgi:hypothetical protein
VLEAPKTRDTFRGIIVYKVGLVRLVGLVGLVRPVGLVRIRMNRQLRRIREAFERSRSLHGRFFIPYIIFPYFQFCLWLSGYLQS